MPEAKLGKRRQTTQALGQTQLHNNIGLGKVGGILLLFLVSGVSSVCLLSQHLFTRGEIVPEKSSKIKPQNSLSVAMDNKGRRKNETDTETEGVGRRN